MNLRRAAALALVGWYLVAALVIAMPPFVLAADQHELTIPLDKGTTWNYSGTARWWGLTKPEEYGARTSRIRDWQMKVMKTARRGDVTASVVQGFPDELAWYEGDAVPPPTGLTLIVQSSTGLFVKSINSDEAEQRMADALDHKLKFDVDPDQILRFPVHVDDCLSTEPLALKYKRWCWHVRTTVKTRFGSGWELEYRTNPDQQLIDIVPGVGVTRYVYHHNGTVADTDVHLVRLPGESRK